MCNLYDHTGKAFWKIILICLPLTAFSQNFTRIPVTVQNSSVAQIPLASNIYDGDWGDYDGDGDMDLVQAANLTGNSTGLSSKTQILRNDGNNKFYDIRASLHLVDAGTSLQGQVRWGDFDNDGDLDVVIIGGSEASLTGGSIIYENTGNDEFSAAAILHPIILGGRLAIADFNLDGKPDLVYSGRTTVGNGMTIGTHLFKNNGNWQFTEIDAGFAPNLFGDLAWIDYNNDQRPDLFMTGTDGTDPHTILYENKGDSFEPVNYDFPVDSEQKFCWGDYNQDGFVDVLIIGGPYQETNSYLLKNNGDGTFTDHGSFLDLVNLGNTDPLMTDLDHDGDTDILGNYLNPGNYTALKIFVNDGSGNFTSFIPTMTDFSDNGYYYRAQWFDYNNDNKIDLSLNGFDSFDLLENNSSGSNTPPSTPGGLSHILTEEGLTLSWTSASDEETPTTALQYDVYVGTAPGKQDLFRSSANTSNGSAQHITTFGNAGNKLSITLPDFNYRGNVYWSVQSIDGSKARSSFAAEETFNIPNEAPLILGQKPINIRTSVSNQVTITLDDLYVEDPDNAYPSDFSFTLAVQGYCDGFSLSGKTVTRTSPTGILCNLSAVVSDGNSQSPPFVVLVTVEDESNPLVTGQVPLEKQKNLPFNIDLTDLIYTNRNPTYNIVRILKGPNYTVSSSVITPATDFLGELKIPVFVQGASVASNVFEVSVQIVEEIDNVVPVITDYEHKTIEEGESFTIEPDDLTVVDPDGEYPTGYTITVGDGDSYTVSGTTVTPSLNFSGILEIPVSVSDGIDESEAIIMEVVVNELNNAPVFDDTYYTLNGQVNEPFTFRFPPALATDPEGDPITYSLSESMGTDISWINFDPSTLTISGTPGDEEFNMLVYVLEITAADNHLNSTTLEILLFIIDYNTSPYAVNPIPNQNAVAGEPYSYDFAEPFWDDESSTVSYALQMEGGGEIPGWLNFDEWSTHLYGTAHSSDAGTITLELVAKDQSGLSASETFLLTVSPGATRDIVSVASIDDLVVPPGTAFDAISFPSVVEVTYNDGSTENLPVTFTSGTYDGTNAADYTIEGTLTLSANTTNTADLRATVNVVVQKQDQTIDFPSLADRTMEDDPFSLEATVSSGLSISYASSDQNVATVSGNIVTIIGTGSTTITASQSGNNNYNAATPVEQTLTVNKANQVITFDALTEKTFGDEAFNLEATVSSGLAVTLTSSDTQVATISGNTISLVGAGSTTITASQSGNNNYNAATPVEQTLTVNKANQVITFDALTEKTFGDEAFNLEATVSSGLAVTFTSSDTQVATISGNTITLVGVGSTTITASQSGNNNHNAATPVEQVFIINKADQTISFEPIPAMQLTDQFLVLEATASSGLPPVYTSSDPSVATIEGNRVTFISAGTTIIMATQPGDINYHQSNTVEQSLVINALPSRQDQVITLQPVADKTIDENPFTLTAFASSGLPVSFTSASDNIAITGNLVTMLEAGRVSIMASQPGNESFHPAEDATVTFCVNPLAPTITVINLDTETPLLTASSNGNFEWLLNGEPIEGVTGHTLSVSVPGEYAVRSMVDDCESEVSEVIPVVITALHDNTSSEDAIKFYPNPVEDELHVSWPSSGESKVTIYRHDGTEIKRIATVENNFICDVSPYASGQYMIIITTSNQIYRQRFIRK